MNIKNQVNNPLSPSTDPDLAEQARLGHGVPSQDQNLGRRSV